MCEHVLIKITFHISHRLLFLNTCGFLAHCSASVYAIRLQQYLIIIQKGSVQRITQSMSSFTVLSWFSISNAKLSDKVDKELLFPIRT
jgi:hypothetical protein